ncbi:winged helix-turn-helix transcriptional regulator [Enterococcus sp. BWB1-3]|nr:MarR family winged helix-turn-helix transcriptional regulator [Enterococcus sp. BWB1-3]MBL1230651.1 winged helix-turn-helix transcriptional regulator [Enterococcus sp. BWB1-3]MCB5956043.1 MarR family winged helix-turn-helix transcriptional regulator [Enterococcus sp. CWB-B31]
MKNFFDDQLIKDYFNFERTMHQYYTWKRREKDGDGISVKEQRRLLSLLTIQPQMNKREVGFLLGMHPKWLNQLLQHLSEKGKVIVEVSKKDSTAAEITLTEAGRKEVAKMDEEKKTSVFDILSDEEKSQFQSIIGKITRELDEELPEDAKKFFKHNGYGRRGFGGKGRKGRFHHFDCQHDGRPKEHPVHGPEFEGFGLFEDRA